MRIRSRRKEKREKQTNTPSIIYIAEYPTYKHKADPNRLLQPSTDRFFFFFYFSLLFVSTHFVMRNRWCHGVDRQDTSLDPFGSQNKKDNCSDNSLVVQALLVELKKSGSCMFPAIQRSIRPSSPLLSQPFTKRAKNFHAFLADTHTFCLPRFYSLKGYIRYLARHSERSMNKQKSPQRPLSVIYFAKKLLPLLLSFCPTPGSTSL